MRAIQLEWFEYTWWAWVSHALAGKSRLPDTLGMGHENTRAELHLPSSPTMRFSSTASCWNSSNMRFSPLLL